MKAITIMQPWAELIVAGKKLIENRIWKTSHRGPLVIHAGKGMAYYDGKDVLAWQERYGCRMPLPDEVVFGALIGVVELVACVHISEVGLGHGHLVGNLFAEGPFCWVLENAIRLSEPIPCAGRQQVWTTDLI
jgi:activating signal cointegrator 1